MTSDTDDTSRGKEVATRDTPSAILLLGPTGSGKTPLGETIERRGLRAHPCAHFDFGDHLRRIAAAEWSPPALSPNDVQIVARAIEERMLLTDEQFHVAESILTAFIEERNVQQDGIIVLNGLPRHAGQALNIQSLATVIAVIELQCSPDTVLARIEQNSGGDRTGRTDDAVDAVRRKLEIYEAQTLPLVEHYRAQRTPVYRVPVNERSSAIDIWHQLEHTVVL